jgi:hypothetical protein
MPWESALTLCIRKNIQIILLILFYAKRIQSSYFLILIDSSFSAGVKCSIIYLPTPPFTCEIYAMYSYISKRGPFSLVSTIEEVLERKCRGFGLENREYGRRDPSRWPLSPFALRRFLYQLAYCSKHKVFNSCKWNEVWPNAFSLDAKIEDKYFQKHSKLGVSIWNGIAIILQRNQHMKHCFNT